MQTEPTVDYFDRQKRIPDWNQEIVEAQVCLCLGCGGLGCTVALDLVRLGVKKIFLFDKDVVDSHNLNRQILFTKEDIGKPKATVAASALEKHNLKTEIVSFHCDVLKNWDKVVAAAKESTVIFNMIDVGEYLDYACQSLALKLKIPFCLGGTFRTTLTVDYFAKEGRPCWGCITDVSNKEVAAKLAPKDIDSYSDISFIPPDNNPVGASNVYVCCTCSNFMVSLFAQSIHGVKVPNRSIFYYEQYDIEKWNMEANSQCPLCGKDEATSS